MFVSLALTVKSSITRTTLDTPQINLAISGLMITHLHANIRYYNKLAGEQGKKEGIITVSDPKSTIEFLEL